MPQGMRREVFGLEEGDAVLSFPDNLCLAGYEHLEAYLQLFLRKAKRRAEMEQSARRPGPVPAHLSPFVNKELDKAASAGIKDDDEAAHRGAPQKTGKPRRVTGAMSGCDLCFSGM
ncbi:MAG: hypothetical protein ACHQAY_22905 [Hyphomicrobiales bacterium]